MLLDMLISYVEKIHKLESELKNNDEKEKREVKSIKAGFEEKKFKIADEMKKNDNEFDSYKNELVSNIQNEYIDKAFFELNTVLNNFDVQKQINKTVNSSSALKEKIKSVMKRNKELESLISIQKQEETKAISDVGSVYIQKNREVEEQIKETVQELRRFYYEKRDNCADDYSGKGIIPNNADAVPKEIVIGNTILATPDVMSRYDVEKDDITKIPYVMNIEDVGSVLIDTDDVTDFKFNMENIALGMSMKYLESFPSNSIKLGLFSSRYLSCPKIDAFYSSLAAAKMTIRPTASTNQYDLSALLKTIEERSNETKDKLWSESSRNLHELFEKGVSSQPFQLIILHDVFKDISEENLNRIHGLVVSGRSIGIYFLIIDDFSKERFKNKTLDFMKTLDDIQEHCKKFTMKKNVITYETNEVTFINVSEDVTSLDVHMFGKEYGQYYEKRKKATVSYEQIGFYNCGNPEGLYDPISIPVAIDGLKVWNMGFSFKDDMPLANLIVGVPGTGKSSLIDAMIINGAMKYSPDELIFHLLDFKDGVSSSAYAKQCAIPHVKVVSTNNKPEEAVIILDNIIQESDRRNSLFKTMSLKNNSPIKNIADYNALIDKQKLNFKKLPKLVVVIDECQHLFADEQLTGKCADIIKKCRSQGIHLVFATQTIPSGAWRTLQFANGRYCFEVVQDDANLLLSRQYASLVMTEVPKGSYMAYASNNNGETCRKIKIAYDDGKMDVYAQAIRKRWEKYPINVVNIGDKSALSIYDCDSEKLFVEGGLNIPIGENYEDHSLCTVEFDGEKQSAMVLVGRDQNNIDNVLISTIMTAHVNEIEAYIVDASKTKRLSEYVDKFGDSTVQVTSGANYTRALEYIYNIYKHRDPEKSYDPIFFIVNATHNIDAIANNTKISKDIPVVPDDYPRAEDYENEDDYIDAKYAYERKNLGRTNTTLTETINAQDALIELVGRGYSRGIFVCVSSDSFTQFNHSSINTLTACDFLFVTYDALPSVKESIIQDRVGVRKYDSINENMMLLKYKHRCYHRFRVINY